MTMAVPRRVFLKNRDEHRWNVLQKIFRPRLGEHGGVIAQLVRDLVDDELSTVRQRVMRLLQKGALLVFLEDTERNTREDVIALVQTAPAQFVRQSGGVAVDHVD